MGLNVDMTISKPISSVLTVVLVNFFYPIYNIIDHLYFLEKFPLKITVSAALTLFVVRSITDLFWNKNDITCCNFYSLLYLHYQFYI